MEEFETRLKHALQTAYDKCREKQVFASDSGSLQLKDSVQFAWPEVNLHADPVLLRTPAAAAIKTKGKATLKSHPSQAHWTSRMLVKLANSWKAYSAKVNGSSSSTAAAAVNVFDVPKVLEAWGAILLRELQQCLLSEWMEASITVSPLDLRVECDKGYINFFASDALLQRLQSASNLGSNSRSTTSTLSSASASTSSLPFAPSLPSREAACVFLPLATADSFQFAVLGRFASVFREKHGTPRQGCVVPEARGQLTLDPRISSDSFDGLAEYTHIWLVFVFDLNGTTFHSAKIQPPRLQGKRVGVFATRTPHRPNPIGLSLARLDRVEGATLFLSGIDLVNNTPVVDIKPYHPADCIRNYQIPNWLQSLPPKSLNVSWSETAMQQLTVAVEAGLQFYSPSETAVVKSLIESILQQDPRTLHSKEHHAGGIYGIALDRIDVCFHIQNPDASATSASSSATVAAASSSPPCSADTLPQAHVIKIVYYKPEEEARRPKLRTKEWFEDIQKELKL